MFATLITNHIAAAQARLMQQYKVIPPKYTLPLQSGGTTPVSAMTAPLISLVDQVQLLENAIFALDAGRQLYNGTTFPAIGAQLDGIGTLVGIARNGLNDTEYLIFILGTIAEDNSDTTATALLTIVSLLFQVSAIIVLELFPAEVDFEIPDTSPLPATLYKAVTNIIAASIGAGIGLGFLALYPAARPFRFARIGVPAPAGSGGFSDLAHPTDGGGFAGLIYNNAGA